MINTGKNSINSLTKKTFIILFVILLIHTPLAIAKRRGLNKLFKEWDMNGFVATSYQMKRINTPSTFSLEEVEFDITRKMANLAFLRTDINFIKEHEYRKVLDFKENVFSEMIVEQGYISLNLTSLSIMAGKFNSPIGFEKIDPPDLELYTHSLIFNYGLPKNLTGVNMKLAYSTLEFDLFMVNGWDKTIDDDNNKSIGGKIGLSSESGSKLYISYMRGDELAIFSKETSTKLSLYNIDFKYTSQKLTLGAEYNKGVQKNNSAINPDSSDSKWSGYMVMAQMGVSDFVGVTFRYEKFNDYEGSRLNKPSGIWEKETRSSLTVAPYLKINKEFLIIYEHKKSSSDKNVFIGKDGNFVNKESYKNVMAILKF